MNIIILSQTATGGENQFAYKLEGKLLWSKEWGSGRGRWRRREGDKGRENTRAIGDGHRLNKTSKNRK